MSSIKEIVEAWWIAKNPNAEQSKLAQQRLQICRGCESMVESVVFGYKCNECGCPIGKKIFTASKGTCDLKKWNKIEGL